MPPRLTTEMVPDLSLEDRTFGAIVWTSGDGGGNGGGLSRIDGGPLIAGWGCGGGIVAAVSAACSDFLVGSFLARASMIRIGSATSEG